MNEEEILLLAKAAGYLMLIFGTLFYESLKDKKRFRIALLVTGILCLVIGGQISGEA